MGIDFHKFWGFAVLRLVTPVLASVVHPTLLDSWTLYTPRDRVIEEGGRRFDVDHLGHQHVKRTLSKDRRITWS